MSHLKQIQHRLYTMISEIILKIKQGYNLLLVALQNFPYQASLGVMLLSLMLLIVITVWLTVICISSLWFLIMMTWMKLPELYKSIQNKVLKFRFTSCHSADDQKSTNSTLNEWPNSQWNEAGDTHLDYTSISSETPGERKDWIDNMRKKGLI